MVGNGFTIQRLLEAVKEVKPLCLVTGTHHFVQMSEIDFKLTGLKRQDLSSVLWITPVGASVPTITAENLKKIFPNMKVSLIIKITVT